MLKRGISSLLSFILVLIIFLIGSYFTYKSFEPVLHKTTEIASYSDIISFLQKTEEKINDILYGREKFVEELIDTKDYELVVDRSKNMLLFRFKTDRCVIPSANFVPLEKTVVPPFFYETYYIVVNETINDTWRKGYLTIDSKVVSIYVVNTSCYFDTVCFENTCVKEGGVLEISGKEFIVKLIDKNGNFVIIHSKKTILVKSFVGVDKFTAIVGRCLGGLNEVGIIFRPLIDISRNVTVRPVVLCKICKIKGKGRISIRIVGRRKLKEEEQILIEINLM